MLEAILSKVCTFIIETSTKLDCLFQKALMLIEPPFEITSLQGHDVEWRKESTIDDTLRYAVFCDQARMLFNAVPCSWFTIWLSHYIMKRRSGFLARADVPLLEFSLQMEGSADYIIKPAGHYMTQKAHFNVSYFPYMESKTWLDKGMQATTLDIHFPVTVLQEQFCDMYPSLNRLIKSIESKAPAVLFNSPLKATPYMIELARTIIYLLQQNTVNQFLLEISVYCLLHHSFTLREQMENKGSKISWAYAERIYLIQHFLDASFLQKLTIPELARQAHMGQVQFKKLFKEITGLPPLRYRNQRRMSKASLDLAYTQNPVKNIAYELGFTTPGNFSTAFSDAFRYSPRTYRKLYS